MNVAELIAGLRLENPKALVMLKGPGDGWREISDIRPYDFALHVQEAVPNVQGPHLLSWEAKLRGIDLAPEKRARALILI